MIHRCAVGKARAVVIVFLMFVCICLFVCTREHMGSSLQRVAFFFLADACRVFFFFQLWYVGSSSPTRIKPGPECRDLTSGPSGKSQ